MKNKILKIFLTSVTLCTFISISSFAATKGWKQDAKGWWFDMGNGRYLNNNYYYIEEPETSQYKGNYCKYYFNGEGYLLTNTHIDDGSYFGIDVNSDGKQVISKDNPTVIYTNKNQVFSSFEKCVYLSDLKEDSKPINNQVNKESKLSNSHKFVEDTEKLEQTKQDLLSLINEYRTSHGMGELELVDPSDLLYSGDADFASPNFKQIILSLKSNIKKGKLPALKDYSDNAIVIKINEFNGEYDGAWNYIEIYTGTNDKKGRWND